MNGRPRPLMEPTLLYNKTPKAWAALAQPALLGRLAHTLILMANGRRSLRELCLLTGTEIGEIAHQLCQAGYLEAQEATAEAARQKASQRNPRKPRIAR